MGRDDIPAKPFLVMRANPKSPMFHVMDFARVQITGDGRMILHVEHDQPGPTGETEGRGLEDGAMTENVGR